MSSDQERRVARHVAAGKPLLSALGLDSSIVSITDGTLGTASDALAEITSSYVEATIANSFATLSAKIEEILVLLKAAGIRD